MNRLALTAVVGASLASPALAEPADGNSRVICGAHSVSAVEAGKQAAAAVVAVLPDSCEFRIDLEAARKELARA